MELPNYRSLPAAAGGGRLGWGIFGGHDSVGLINLQTPERVVDATRLVRRGALFPLNTPLDIIDPPLFGRRRLTRTEITALDGTALDDRLDDFYPQGASQWDALAHFALSKQDGFYNGAMLEDIRSGRNTIDHWARRGIAGRAVLLDLAEILAEDEAEYSPGTSTAIDTGHLERAVERSGTSLREGDILLVHTGFLTWYVRLAAEERARLSAPDGLHAVGVEHSESMAEWLWDKHICAIATDAPGVEVWPPDRSKEGQPFGFLHRMLIGSFGLALGELWWLADLAADCERDGVYEMFLTSAPLCIPGGVGSPPNALAIK